MTAGFWNRIKAGWYQKGLKYSSFPKLALPFMLSKAGGSKTFLDIGSGCGTLAVPLAKAGKKVTALDSSPAMIAILKEEIKKQGLKGITPVLSQWDRAKVKRHDVVVCANVPALLKGSLPFLKDADDFAKKAVFLIESAGPDSDKFYYKELYPLIFKKPFSERTDYLTTYIDLHSIGILANVEIIEYDFDQPFDNLDEALLFWKEYMGIVTEEHDRTLRDYLSKKLVKSRKALLAKFHKKAAIIWWRKG